MGFTVRFRDRDEAARFGETDMFAIDGGALVVDRGDGTTSIYSSSFWETVELDSSDDPAFMRLPR